ncbi:MAG: AAA family ATPase [Prevotella sp.]|nr:AAA family ATPase [Candidatus Prevotella equi]
MSRFYDGLTDSVFCAVKELIRSGFRVLRVPSVTKKRNAIEARLYQIEYSLVDLEMKRKVEDFTFQQSMPSFRSLDETLSSTSEALKYLFGGLMVEGGTYVVFAQKGQGKSTFAMQMALALAKGKDLKLFSEYNRSAEDISPHHVLYLDYELSAIQIKERYRGVSAPTLHWLGTCRSKNTSDCMKLMEEYLLKIPEGEEVVVFVDNLTKIGCGYSQPTEAKELYARLDGLKHTQKNKHGRTLTVILVTHTQKDVKPGAPLTQNDYSGAQDIIISADGVFAIGPTKFGNDTKYLKVLNNRNAIEPDTVSVIKHVNQPYSRFEVVSEMSEADALAGRATSSILSSEKEEPKYPKLTISQVEEMRTRLSQIDPETGKNFTKKKVAEFYHIPESYVKRYKDGSMKPIPDHEPEIG